MDYFLSGTHAYIAGYLIIFIPLIFSALCFVTVIPKLDFIISSAAIILVFAILVSLIPNLLIHEKIANDIDIGVLSIATEYRIDLLGMFFLLMVVFIKTITGFFYKADIDKIFDNDAKRLFYCTCLLNLFALIGIFTTNNILNLYIFIEIYSFTFYATTSMSKELPLTKLAFRYFCIGVVGSILLLISFISLYIITGGAQISSIINDVGYLLEVNSKIAFLIFLLTATAIFLKFFPIWLYFEKIKSNNFLANFLSISSLFIKTNIGLYLLIRLSFFLFGINFFGELKFDIILIIIGVILIFYSNIKLLKSNNLKTITSYLCLTNLGFILTCIGIHNRESLIASFFYIINFSFINLLIFLFASFLSRNYASCNIKYLHVLRKENLLVSIPLKIIIFFTCGFPLTVVFLANWHLAYSVMDFDLFLFILIPLITTSFANIKLTISMINNFYFSNKNENHLIKKTASLKYNNFLYLISFWAMLIIAVCFGLGANILTDINNRLSVFILSNTM